MMPTRMVPTITGLTAVLQMMPTTVRAGATVHYTVAVTNTGPQPVLLQPCPAYREALGAATATYRLNCAPTPSLPTGSTIRYLLRQPAGLTLGTSRLTWELPAAGLALTGSVRVLPPLESLRPIGAAGNCEARYPTSPVLDLRVGKDGVPEPRCGQWADLNQRVRVDNGLDRPLTVILARHRLTVPGRSHSTFAGTLGQLGVPPGVFDATTPDAPNIGGWSLATLEPVPGVPAAADHAWDRYLRQQPEQFTFRRPFPADGVIWGLVLTSGRDNNNHVLGPAEAEVSRWSGTRWLRVQTLGRDANPNQPPVGIGDLPGLGVVLSVPTSAPTAISGGLWALQQGRWQPIQFQGCQSAGCSASTDQEPFLGLLDASTLQSTFNDCRPTCATATPRDITWRWDPTTRLLVPE